MAVYNSTEHPSQIGFPNSFPDSLIDSINQNQRRTAIAACGSHQTTNELINITVEPNSFNYLSPRIATVEVLTEQ
jgi:hypothetical protein